MDALLAHLCSNKSVLNALHLSNHHPTSIDQFRTSVNITAIEGHGFLSKIYRITSRQPTPDAPHNDTAAIIVKVQAVAQSLEEYKGIDIVVKLGFQREVDFFVKIYPRLSAAGQSIIPGLIAIHTDTQPQFIVMEDLVQSGYASVDRFRRLDRAQLVAAIGALVRFQAQLEEQREMCQSLPLFTTDLLLAYSGEFMQLFKKDLHELELLSPATEWSKLQSFLERTDYLLHRRLLEGAVHGDYWIENLFFKSHRRNDGDEHLECKIIDFQFVSYGSSRMDDLFILLVSSAQEWVFESRESVLEMLRLYANTFPQPLDWAEVMTSASPSLNYTFLWVIASYPAYKDSADKVQLLRALLRLYTYFVE